MQYDRILPLFIGTDDDDLEFYVRKCGEIMGVTPKLDKDHRDAKSILEHIFFHLVEFKKLNQVRTLCCIQYVQISKFFFFFAGKWSRNRTTPDDTWFVKGVAGFLILPLMKFWHFRGDWKHLKITLQHFICRNKLFIKPSNKLKTLRERHHEWLFFHGWLQMNRYWQLNQASTEKKKKELISFLKGYVEGWHQRHFTLRLRHRLYFRTTQLLKRIWLHAWFGAVTFWFYQWNIPAHLSGSEVTV